MPIYLFFVTENFRRKKQEIGRQGYVVEISIIFSYWGKSKLATLQSLSLEGKTVNPDPKSQTKPILLLSSVSSSDFAQEQEGTEDKESDQMEW